MATRVAALAAGFVLALGGALTIGSATASGHPLGIRSIDPDRAPQVIQVVERATIPT